MFRALPFLVSLAFLGSSLTAHAEPAAPSPSAPDAGVAELARRERARAAFSSGLELVERGEFGLAKQQFLTAHAERPHALVLFSLASVCKELGELTQAIQYLEQALARDSSELRADERSRVEQMRRELVPRVTKRNDARRSVRVVCSIPDVSVSSAGVTLGVTPLDSNSVVLNLPQTVQQLRLSRPGYAIQAIDLDTTKRVETVDCALTPLERKAQLLLEVSESGAALAVDGEVSTSEPRVAGGRHVVTATRRGFKAYRRVVTAPPAGPLRVAIELEPTAAHRLSHRSAVSRQRVIAYVLAGGGVALAGSALGVYLYNGQRYVTWERENRELPATSANPATQAAISRHEELQESIETWDTGARLMLIGGAAMLAGGAVLYLTTDDPERYDRRPRVSLVAAGPALLLNARF